MNWIRLQPVQNIDHIMQRQGSKMHPQTTLASIQENASSLDVQKQTHKSKLLVFLHMPACIQQGARQTLDVRRLIYLRWKHNKDYSPHCMVAHNWHQATKTDSWPTGWVTWPLMGSQALTPLGRKQRASLTLCLSSSPSPDQHLRLERQTHLVQVRYDLRGFAVAHV